MEVWRLPEQQRARASQLVPCLQGETCEIQKPSQCLLDCSGEVVEGGLWGSGTLSCVSRC